MQSASEFDASVIEKAREAGKLAPPIMPGLGSWRLAGVNEDAQIEQHFPLLQAAARRFAGRFRHDYDDCLQNGAIGLLEAIRGYDESKGVPFEAFARSMAA